MPNPIQHVNPGDLITSVQFNEFADHVNDLVQRVTVLEAVLQPSTHVTLQPLLGSVRIGDPITVQGTNFAVPVTLNNVRLDGQPVTQFNPGTDDSHLVFNVPSISGTPRDVTFSVQNNTGSASIVITVLPATGVVPVGEMRITQVAVNTGPITIGQSYVFPFVLDSQTNIPEEYLVSLTFANTQGAATGAWQSASRISNMANQTVNHVTVAPGSPVTVRAEVTIPAGAVRADLLLNVVSVNNPTSPDLNVIANPVALVVGAATQVSDPRTSVAALLTAPSSRLVTDPVLGQVIATPVGQQTLVRVTAEFSVAGAYTYSARVVPSTPLWTVTMQGTTSSTETAGSSQEILTQLAAVGADTTPTRVIEIHAARTGPGGELFDSWLSVPIRNG